MQRAILPLVAVLAVLAAGCGDDDAPTARSQTIDVWIEENQPERVQAMRDNVAEFTRRTGVKVKLGVLGDGELVKRTNAALKGGPLPDVTQIGMANAHAEVKRGILDSDAAQQAVSELGEETFSARALSLLTSEGGVAAVPSDGWGQLLIYRKDLFDKAGLDAPASLNDILRAARRLHRRGLAGITLATESVDGAFTSETFEHVALAAGCQLVNDAGDVDLDSPECRRAFSLYVELARDYSPGGKQDVDTTRDVYFAGRAAMIFWSPFLLDAMAGLRDEAPPTCRQCKEDPAYLARNSGLVGPLIAPGDAAAQFGNITTWGITTDGDAELGKRFVKYMMSDGYLRWLAISPQGKFPVRAGDSADPERFERGWAELESGVDRRAPLSEFYSEESVESLGDGVRSFRRWAFEQDQAALVGALADGEPVVAALAKAIEGEITPAQAAREAQAAVEKVQGTLTP